jgi:hypothetical protein
MPKIVKAVDDRGRVYRVTEEEAKARDFTVTSETNEANVATTDASNKKRTTASKRAVRRKK